MPLPQRLRLDAWLDGPAAADLDPSWRAWAFQDHGTPAPGWMRPPRRPELSNWLADDVGWGLLVQEPTEASTDLRKIEQSLPAALRTLLQHRRGVLLCQPSGLAGYLRRYDEDGDAYDVNTAGAARGTGYGRLPHYILIHGGPEDVPWSVQFHLGTSFAVGRVHLRDEPLERYVDALLRPPPAEPRRAVVWSVDHGPEDITSVLHEAVALPIWQKLHDDPDIADGAQLLHAGTGVRATGTTLREALAAARPGLVVTSSHGLVPRGAGAFTSNLGVPVDDVHQPVDVAALLDQWDPDGAVWYAHACCSAGSNGAATHRRLLAPGTRGEEVMNLLAQRPRAVAPLATRLLSAPKPLRAFIGHVEPTFDITVRDPNTGQALTDSLVQSLHDGLYQPFPVGHALRPWFAQRNAHLDAHITARAAYDEGDATQEDEMLVRGLAAADHQKLVVLGDPAAAIRDLDSQVS
jgi:hypothetical protein